MTLKEIIKEKIIPTGLPDLTERFWEVYSDDQLQSMISQTMALVKDRRPYDRSERYIFTIFSFCLADDRVLRFPELELYLSTVCQFNPHYRYPSIFRFYMGPFEILEKALPTYTSLSMDERRTLLEEIKWHHTQINEFVHTTRPDFLLRLNLLEGG